jgi:hypothetical protein
MVTRQFLIAGKFGTGGWFPLVFLESLDTIPGYFRQAIERVGLTLSEPAPSRGPSAFGQDRSACARQSFQ